VEGSALGAAQEHPDPPGQEGVRTEVDEEEVVRVPSQREPVLTLLR